MKTLKYYFFIIPIVLFSACTDEEVDTEKPSIDITISNAFPLNCDTIYYDETFILKALLSDNEELASYNIDVHNNFDQHSHSTESESCTFDPIKTPENPFTFIQNYTIPGAVSEYTTDISITFPAGSATGLHDEGDYHFQITVVDKEGWSDLKILNVKLLHR